MDANAILGLLIPVTYFLMLVMEAIWPARRFPEVKLWRATGVGFLLLGFAASVVVPALIPVGWLASHRLIDGSRLGIVGGAVVGFVAIQLVAYIYHYAFHKSSFLWRWHQMHHASRRIDTSASMIFHPFELLLQQAIGIIVGTFTLGLNPVAAGIVGYLLAATTMFQHINVRTPHWLGYIIQRPEAHCVHHQTDVHAYNYAHLPLWDMVFGTFRNPRTFEGQVGFGAPVQWAKLLVGNDVSTAMESGPRLAEEA